MLLRFKLQEITGRYYQWPSGNSMILFRSSRDQTHTQQRNTVRVCTVFGTKISRTFHGDCRMQFKIFIDFISLKNTLGCDTRFFSHLHWEDKAGIRTLRPIWRSTTLTTKTKLRVFGFDVKAVLLYGSETRRLTKGLHRSCKCLSIRAWGTSCGLGGLD